MEKPSQDDVDTCRAVIEYAIADMEKNEPHAVNTIADFEATLGSLPNEDEFGDVDD